MKKFYVAFVFLFLFSFAHAQDAPFITTWEVEETNGRVYISTDSSFEYDYTVDFGDGTVLNNQNGDASHYYSSEGIYIVTISGIFPYFHAAYEIQSVEQWGDIEWQSMEDSFSGCENLVINATDTPDLSQVTNMSGMFSGCDFLNQPLNNWDVSNVTDMNGLFAYGESFNQPLSNWDVSNVTDMHGMFSGLISFDQPLNNWDVSNVTNMNSMFSGASEFNQNLNSWNMSNVSSISSMFKYASSFNSPVNAWDVSNIQEMAALFLFASSFDQPLNNWNVSNVNTMGLMFFEATSFNQPLNDWNTSSVNGLSSMFSGASSFNQPLDNWDVSNVTNMNGMFKNANSFNGELNSWDVSSVTYMYDLFREATSFNQPLNEWNTSSLVQVVGGPTTKGMFYGATSFNQPIGNWDVSHINKFNSMFNGATSFNQNLNNWDVSNATEMQEMFRDATSFNQPLNNWDVSNVSRLSWMFDGATNFNQDLSNWQIETNNLYKFLSGTNLDITNYDAFLSHLSTLSLNDGELGSSNLKYCDTAVRDYLIDNLSWVISGDSQSPNCNTITGNILYDENGDGCDENDIEVTGFMINADNGEQNSMTFSTNGSYILGTIGDAYTLSVINYPEYYVVSPETVDIDFSGGGDQEQLDFCLTANQAIEDLNITLLPINQARPGFEADYQVVVKNMGTQTLNGVTVNLTFDDSKQVFTEASEIPTAETANSLTFELNELPPFGTQTIDLTMQTFEPPTVNGEDVLAFTANVTPNESDYTPEDNMVEFDQEVVNSFDPNDKQVVQGDEIEIEEADQYLDYIIRFQNTGTASAINVRILDTLHPKLDWNTLQPVSASDDYRIEITDGNNVEFIFDDINLPYEDENEPGSHGFIAYKIKLKANVAIGDVITGDAGIYFDFNAPIITNTVSTEIVENLGVENYRLGNQISFYPNPTKDFLNIQTSKNVQLESVTIYNLQGRELLNFQQNLETLNLQQLSAGMYILKIKTDRGMLNQQLIKQ